MEQIKIDIVPVGVAPVAHASQFDNSRQIRFNLFNQGTPYTLTGAETVTMVVNGEEENITNTSDNYVIWDVAEEDCAEVGVIGCEIRIVLGSMLIGSKNFFLEVEMDPYNGKNIRTITVGPADICTFETTLPEPLQSVIVDVVATGGNGTPDNPNPIVGYSSANITRCGVNLNDENPTVIRTTSATSNQIIKSHIYLKEGVTYCFSCEQVGSMTSNERNTLNIEDESITGKTYESAAPNYMLSGGIHSMTYTPTHDGLYSLRLWTVSLSSDTTYKNFMLEVGSTPSAFVAYNGQTYAIAFGQTVYGGVLDVTRGKLTVTWAKKPFADLVDVGGWNRTGTGIFYIYPLSNAFSNFKSPFTDNPKSTHFNYQTSGTLLDGCFRCSDALYFVKDDEPDIASMKTWFTNTDGFFTYELATPFDIDLTPVQISALVGENNVFADCGETTVKYLKAGA